jgi:hypothetical protein
VDSWLYRENLRDETYLQLLIYRARKQACVSFDAVSATKARQKKLEQRVDKGSTARKRALLFLCQLWSETGDLFCFLVSAGI